MPAIFDATIGHAHLLRVPRVCDEINMENRHCLCAVVAACSVKQRPVTGTASSLMTFFYSPSMLICLLISDVSMDSSLLLIQFVLVPDSMCVDYWI
jgi:hypothetical protein